MILRGQTFWLIFRAIVQFSDIGTWGGINQTLGCLNLKIWSLKDLITAGEAPS
jgi:hypothetical protein